MSVNTLNPAVRLPPELFMLVVDLLPICDVWRLRRVSQSWKSQLSSLDTLRAVTSRWNTHDAEQRASSTSDPLPTPVQDAERIESFLSGRPKAYTTIVPTEMPDYGVIDLQLRGKWLAYRTNHELGGPMHIDLWDLTTGEKRSFKTEASTNPGIALSTDMIACTTRNPTYGEPKYKDELLNNAITTIDLHDFSVKTVPLSHPVAMQGGMREAVHKHCVVTTRHRGVSPYDEHVEIYDRLLDKSWSFRWTAPVRDTMSFTFMIDADNRTVQFWSAFNKYVQGTSPGIENMIDRCMVAIDVYSFEGTKLSRSEKEILLDNQDHREMGIVGPWIMKLSSAGAHKDYTAHIDYWPHERITTIMRVDWKSTADCIDRYYRLNGNVFTWKDMVFHLNKRGQLFIRRNSSPEAMDARSLTRCDDQALPADTDPEADGVDTPALAAVNESFLVLLSKRNIRVYSFDVLACGSMSESDIGSNDEASGRGGLRWHDASDLFVRDDSATIIHRMSGPKEPANDDGAPDPILNSLMRMQDMLSAPI